MKACRDCKHYGQMGPIPVCTGPHLAPHVVAGVAWEQLPTARFLSHNPQIEDGGVLPDHAPCGKEGRYWLQREDRPAVPERKSTTGQWMLTILLLVAFGVGFLLRGCGNG